MSHAKSNHLTCNAWCNGTTALSTRAVVLLPVVALAIASPAHANPQGGVVAGGSATIVQSGNTLDINQTSSRAIINWSSRSTSRRARRPSSTSRPLPRSRSTA